MGCASCGRGFHSECRRCSKGKCHPAEEETKSSATRLGQVGAPIKDAKDVKDPYSTGRKRAAIQYPLRRDQPCEWRGQKNVGGGKKPIIGCIDGLQEARHHGPIKSPMENSPGNVHRICHFCHNRWHALNNPEYVELLYKTLPHNPELATEEELLMNKAYWIGKQLKNYVD